MDSNSNSLRSCNIVSESLYLVIYTSEGIKSTAEVVSREVGPGVGNYRKYHQNVKIHFLKIRANLIHRHVSHLHMS